MRDSGSVSVEISREVVVVGVDTAPAVVETAAGGGAMEVDAQPQPAIGSGEEKEKEADNMEGVSVKERDVVVLMTDDASVQTQTGDAMSVDVRESVLSTGQPTTAVAVAVADSTGEPSTMAQTEGLPVNAQGGESVVAEEATEGGKGSVDGSESSVGRGEQVGASISVAAEETKPALSPTEVIEMVMDGKLESMPTSAQLVRIIAEDLAATEPGVFAALSLRARDFALLRWRVCWPPSLHARDFGG